MMILTQVNSARPSYDISYLHINIQYIYNIIYYYIPRSGRSTPQKKGRPLCFRYMYVLYVLNMQYVGVSKNRGWAPQIIHLFIGFGTMK